jgi:hypothetical protein
MLFAHVYRLLFFRIELSWYGARWINDTTAAACGSANTTATTSATSSRCRGRSASSRRRRSTATKRITESVSTKLAESSSTKSRTGYVPFILILDPVHFLTPNSFHLFPYRPHHRVCHQVVYRMAPPPVLNRAPETR